MPSNITDNIYSSEYRDSAQPIPATIIGYDNTMSELAATNVQAAIDEVVGDIGNLDGADIAYDNTTSALSATNVQAAIDEVVGDIGDIVQMPSIPSSATDGTYILKATVSSGEVTYSWIAEV